MTAAPEIFHSFDVAVAAKVGTTAATLHKNLTFWINLNLKKGHNIKDGRAWVYYSCAEQSSTRGRHDLFPLDKHPPQSTHGSRES